jgi:hypothetical protein
MHTNKLLAALKAKQVLKDFQTNPLAFDIDTDSGEAKRRW